MCIQLAISTMSIGNDLLNIILKDKVNQSVNIE